MGYLAFALKYRPQNFDQVVGQTQVVTSLKNAILKERVHHAYLFSGPRGVGKTSLARIFAKSLNCTKGPTPSPCGKCPSCEEIVRGTSLDIIEIDGASNRGIDEIRTLRENVKLSPAQARYKIYIIDEVHMLTQEAFNALLKTLEEPPSHVKFIFATTHPHKVLPTILSRCQKFQFSLLPLEEIVRKLKMIARQEQLKIDDSLLYAIARAAGGSIRDAESLLDQLAPVILEKGSIEDVLSFLGIIDEDTLNTALKFIVEKDTPAILNFIGKLTQEGKDLGVFLNAMIEHLRNLLLVKVSERSFRELIDVSLQTKELIHNLSKDITISEALKVIDLLIEAKESSQKLNTVRVPLELALIKFSYRQELQASLKEEKRIEVKVDTKKVEAESNSSLADRSSSETQPSSPREPSLSPPPDVSSSETRSSSPKEPSLSPLGEIDDFDLKIEDFDLPEQEPIGEKSTEAEHDREKDEAASDNLLVVEVKAKWQKILSDIQRVRAAIASHLSYAQPVSSCGNVITIAFPKKNYFHKEIVESLKNLNFIEGVISKFMDREVKIKFTTTEEPLQDSKESGDKESQDIAPEKDNPETEAQDDEFINRLLDTFRGKVKSGDG